MATTGRSDTKRDIRAAQIKWLRDVLRVTGKTASQLANEAGLADVTLTRFLNREDYEGVLSPLTVRLLAEHANVPGPEGEPIRNGRGFLEEGHPFHYEHDAPLPVLSEIVTLLLRDRPNAAPWVLDSDVLEGVGYLRGDTIIVDMAAKPYLHAAVCAQVQDGRGGAKTVFRVYDPPVITAANHSLVDRPAPLIVDHVRVQVVGVVTNGVRMPAVG